jgi:hypothetical protein
MSSSFFLCDPCVAAQEKRMDIMRIRLEEQVNPVADDVLALVAVVQPILVGVLFALKQEVVNAVGGYDKVSMKMLTRYIDQVMEIAEFVSNMAFTTP